MTFFPLPLFPDFSLPSSIMVTVFIGVWVLCFFNLRFGWPLSGLVVPGFVAPILLAQPQSAAFILAEGTCTYLLARGVSRALEVSGVASPFFGRDRFFLIVLLGVLVRLLGDALLLPLAVDFFLKGGTPSGSEVVAHVTSLFGPTVGEGDLARLGLGSFGLVVSALFANQLWKPGLLRGSFAAVVTLALTYVATRYVLVPFTNFNPGRLAFLYNEVGSRLSDSPKAYIILLSTAFLSSRLNLLFGWEFSGIMIPSLLALAWFDPMSVVLSLFEAFAILVVGQVLLKLPAFRSLSMEGARKILFFFSVSFLLKMGVMWGIYLASPAEQASDFFGFGFLLSTLIAIKAHDKKIFVRMAGTTLQASAAGLAIGLGVSALLAQMRDFSGGGGPTTVARGDDALAAESLRLAVPLQTPVTSNFNVGPTAFASLHRVFVETPDLFAEPGGGTFRVVDETWLRQFSTDILTPFVQSVASLEAGRQTPENFRATMAALAKRAEAYCYVVELLPRTQTDEPSLTATLGARVSPSAVDHAQGVAVLSERPHASCRRFQAALAVRWMVPESASPEQVEPVVFSVPRPRADTSIIEASLSAFERLSARALIIPLAHPDAHGSGGADVLSHQGRTSVYVLAQEVVLRTFAKESAARGEALRVLEIRGTPDAAAPARLSAPFGQDALVTRLSLWCRDVRPTRVGLAQEAMFTHNRALELLAESLGAGSMGTLWLSRDWRETFAFRGRPESFESLQFRSLGIRTREASLASLLQLHGVEGNEEGVPTRLRELLRGYLLNGEISQIDALRAWPGVASLERVVDTRTRQSFLLFRSPRGKVLWVAALGSTSPGSVHALKAGLELTEANVDVFAISRLGWLEFST
ncbi:MAG: hypothetical protein IOD12_09760 [Silvanigrellales bacterium]|nr:hypothetical protein [Silvanigrellales bacterium]